MESPYATVPQFCKRHPAFAIGGVRDKIFHEHENGLNQSGAILRVGRRVLIHEQRFFEWVENQGKT